MTPSISFPSGRVLSYAGRVDGADSLVDVRFAVRDWPRFWRTRERTVTFRCSGNGWWWQGSGVQLVLAPAHVWQSLREAYEETQRPPSWHLCDAATLELAMKVYGFSHPNGYAAASELRRRLTGEPLPPFGAKRE